VFFWVGGNLHTSNGIAFGQMEQKSNDRRPAVLNRAKVTLLGSNTWRGNPSGALSRRIQLTCRVKRGCLCQSVGGEGMVYHRLNIPEAMI
jgi:hypothetical protein